MKRWLQKLLDIREGERATTFAMITYIFLIIAVLTMVKSVRQSLFLQKFGAASLPYVYLMIAAVAGTIATIYQRFAKNVPVHRLIVWTMGFVILNLLIFRLPVVAAWEPMAYVLYVWVAVYGILTTAQFWLLANEVYDPRQAKRLFAILGTGATLGGIAGGYITQYGAPVLGTENLLFVSVAMIVVCAALAIYVGRAEAGRIQDAARALRYKASAAEKTAGGFRLIWESRYLKLVMAVISISIIIATVVDNQFSFVVQEHIPDKDAKTAFFGQFFTWLGWIGFLTQFFVTGRLVRRFGIGVAMAILPVALFLGSGVFVLVPMLSTGVLVKIADGAFRYTTHKASLELLYLPIPVGVKNKTKTFIDVFTDRFSKGIAALLVLLVTSVLGFEYTALSWFMMGLALLWIVVTIFARREYVAAFRDSLMRRRIDEDELILSPTDAATVDAMAEALNRADDMRAARLLELISGVKSPVLVTPLVRLAQSQNPIVSIRALDLLALQDSGVPAVQLLGLLDRTDVEVVSRVVRILCSDGARLKPVRLGPYLADDRPVVRLGAVMAALRYGDDAAGDIVDPETLERFLTDSGGQEDRRQLDRLMASLLRALPPGPIATNYMQRFLNSDDPEVRLEAIRAAARLRPRELVEPLVRALADRRLRYRVRDALAAYGESVIGTLADYFQDRRTPRAVRFHIPRVLERIPCQRAVDVLVSVVSDPDESVRFAALRSLGRIRSQNGGLVYTHEVLQQKLREEIAKSYRYQDWQLGVSATDATALLRKTLAEKYWKATDRLFRLLAMQHPPDDVYAAARALRSPNPRIRANAVEYLDNILAPGDKRWVLGLVDDRPSRERIERALKELGDESTPWPALLERQAQGPDDWLAACALYTIWADRQTALFHLLDKADGSLADWEDRPLTKETLSALRVKRAATQSSHDTDR
ncbi:MAG: Npt1/Npt2 family nucleotide transporter [Candidatus Zixiibacteriota bacterium]